MKRKIANILRRWADKLSPGPEAPLPWNELLPWNDTTRWDRVMAKAHYSRAELNEIERNPDLAQIIDQDKHQHLVKLIARRLMAEGYIAFHTEPELCPDSHDALVATVYVARPRQ